MLIAIPARFAYVLDDDLGHPEHWNDWQHDPKVYLPMLAVVVVVGVILGGRILWTELRERHARRRKHQ